MIKERERRPEDKSNNEAQRNKRVENTEAIRDVKFMEWESQGRQRMEQNVIFHNMLKGNGQEF